MFSGTISIKSGSSEEVLITIEPNKKFLLGRTPELGQMKDCEKIELAHQEISQFHALILTAPDGWCIVELGSTNGTKLNGKRIKTNLEYYLYLGDEISIADAATLKVLACPGEDRQVRTMPESSGRVCHYNLQELTKPD